MKPLILSENNTPITDVFGKDTDKVLAICEKIYLRHLWPVKEGYPTHPAISVGKITPKTCPNGQWKQCMREWLVTHPKEAKEFADAKAAWEVESARLWKALFGMAKRKRIRIKWLGENTAACMPDQFLLYKEGKRIGMIQC